MTMTLERRQEIALMALKHWVKKNGLPSLDESWWEGYLHGAAQRMGIGLDEAHEFFETLVREAVEGMFAPAPEEPKPQGEQFGEVCEGRR